MPNDLNKLQNTLNYRFSDQSLLKQALTHRSAEKKHNERLEFLGDSLLGFVVADSLYSHYQSASEGELSRMRSSIVNNISLASIAREMKLGDYLQLGSGELKSGGKDRDSILANTVEALIASIYLDAGMTACEDFIKTKFASVLQSEDAIEQRLQRGKDSKTCLQELMQSKALPLPVYKVLEVGGAAHEQVFHVSCKVTLLDQAFKGCGSSKREAQQLAAANVLLELGEV